jgi:hypothetical protein
LAARSVDHPALADSAGELRLLALDFLGYLRLLRASSGPNRGQPVSDGHIVHVMGDVEQFYAFMADHRHEAASKLADHRWRHLAPGCGGSARSRSSRARPRRARTSTTPR